MSARSAVGELLERSLREGRILDGREALAPQDARPLVAQLEQAGVRPREGVGLCFENGPACILAYAALARLDAVAVPLPPTLLPEERSRLWRRLGCRIVVGERGVAPLDAAAGGPSWPEDVHWVMHSSGSTGTPKAIPITLSAMQRNADEVMEILDLGTDLLHLGTMSQCYTNGLYNSFLLPLLTGGRTLIGPVASVMALGAFTEVLRTGAPEVLWVNPTVVTLLRRRVDVSDLRRVRALVSCTAPLREADCAVAEQKLGRPVLQSYGLTETLIVSIERPDRDVATEFSAGVVVGGPEAVSLGPGGLLEIHNGAVTPGYASFDGTTLSLGLDEGEPGRRFVSGDLGAIDDAGRLAITGRTANVINVGGVKLGAELLETALCGAPGVKGALVVGVADARGSERPVALVIAERALDLDALAAHCVERVGPHARPAAIHVVPELPLTANGKPDRPAALAWLRQQSPDGPR